MQDPIALGNGNGTHNGVAQAWLQNSVRSFFEQIYWEGRPPIPDSDAGGGSAMTLTVQDFFASFPWDGQPQVASPLSPLEFQPQESPPEDDSMTLDDFFDLF